ncbi:OmpA family protein [Cyclobacterium jeungdonense]|uniref:OmpA family protein n=1 Tax=Cyclobacterium jeungdonense TaxID=708087 RepID=A0ABT8CBE1_9BACT|nr:OmpA family protein [Cyclobacterium jeungdonense]MDN3689702.1 OmpA family protein [Cyclobacterium jeungdonense]
MKKIFTYLIPPIFLGMLCMNVQAQQGLLRYADKKASEENYFEAGKGYVDAYAKNPSFQAAKGAAKAYGNLRDYQNAYDWWKKTVAFQESGQEELLAYIAAANQAGQQEAVFAALDTMETREHEAITNLHLDSLQHWYAVAGNTGVKKMEGINSSNTEFGWVKGAQGRAYFSSDRGEAGNRNRSSVRIDKSYKYYTQSSDWTGRNFLNIYSVNEEGKISLFDPPVPDVFHATDPFPLQEQEVLFYTVTRDIRSSENYEVQSEIYFSRLDNAGNPIDFVGLSLNSPLEYGLKSPFVDEAENRLYFSSNMAGGQGGYDLYYMDYNSDFEFQAPVNLGPLINSPGNEIDPYIHEGMLYFASDGHVGMGGLDLFVSDFKGDEFLGVKNLGLPFNSPQDDFGFFETNDDKVLISSNRLQSTGWDDIFEMETLELDFLARVLECDGTAVTGPIEVNLAEGADNTNLPVEKRGQGLFHAKISPEEDQEIHISKAGYFAVQDNTISTKGLESGTLEKTYQLVKIPYKTAVHVDLVYYNLDESVIRSDAESALDRVAELLKSYSFLNIVVRSHTDERASNEYNELLSEKRADAVRDYLGKYGIDSSRIEAEWFGETELTEDCGEGVPCTEDRHQLNRRTELLLLAFPEVGKSYQVPLELQEVDLCDVSNIQLPQELPTIYFGFDQATLSLADKMALERVALMLRNMVERRLAITGHTDSRGSAAYNEELSKRRALVVKNYLEGKGIASERLVYEFFGKTKPVNDCEGVPCTPEMHKQNRRTELILPSIPQPKKKR